MTETEHIIQLLQKITDNTASSGEFRMAVITTVAAISGTLIGVIHSPEFTTRS